MLYIEQSDIDLLTEQVLMAGASLVDKDGLHVRSGINSQRHGRLIQHMLRSLLGLCAEDLVEVVGVAHLQGNAGRRVVTPVDPDTVAAQLAARP